MDINHKSAKRILKRDTGTLHSAHTHIKEWKIPTRRHFHASTTMLMQPHRWKLPDKDQEQTQSQVEKTQQLHPAK